MDRNSWLPSHVLYIQVCSFSLDFKFIDPIPISLVLTVRTLYKTLSEIKELLSGDESNVIDKSQYLRVLIIAILGSVCLVPLGLYSFVSGWIDVRPWPGWKEIHADISQIEQIPVDIWRSDRTWQYNLEILRWEFVFNAFAIFALFGFQREACMSYMSAMRYLFQCVLCRCCAFLIVSCCSGIDFTALEHLQIKT